MPAPQVFINHTQGKMAEKTKSPEEIFNEDSDEDQFIDALEKEANEERTGDFDVEKENIDGGERGAHAISGADNSDEDGSNGPDHEVADT